jgi:hypothetical protein
MKRIFLFLSALLLVAPILVFAQSKITISTSIPGMGVVTPNTPPGAYINGFYNFLLMMGGLLALGAIVYGGILYAASGGNPSKQSEGKSWIWSALTGLLLLAGAYLILYTINPNLTNLTLPSLESIKIVATPGVGGTGTGSVTCTPAPSGPCSVSQLQETCMGSNATAASEICQAESGGIPSNGGDKSTSGQPVSIGLFQINLTQHPIGNLNCPLAFDHPWHMLGVCGKGNTGCGPSTIVNQALYAKCVAAIEPAAQNISEACSVSGNGQNWSQWSTAAICF